MKFLMILFSLLLTFSGQAAQLRVGDVLLQPLNCWACTLIEVEENSLYSHMGIVISENPVLVAEAYGPIRALPLEQFLGKTEKGQKVGVLRFKDQKIRSKFTMHGDQLRELFKTYQGLPFDDEFLWSNFNEQGQELYYCSEFVTKFLEPFLGIQLPLKRMEFLKNRQLWEIYFKGKIPDGEWGNSPADYERSELFLKIGEL